MKYGCTLQFLSSSRTSMSRLVKKVITTSNAPKAIGPYRYKRSQAVAVNGTLYLSGQLGLDPKTAELVSPNVVDQTHQALKNIGEILKSAGCKHTDVVKATVLMTDIGDFALINEVYRNCEWVIFHISIDFAEPFPARSAYQVAALPKV
ncbi:unnamed protein product [Protopolystoma xenopodis]|uniref:2-iminobutanoate/2-iminopropanoate deaminase n=1 Tax=Protopolystoma xenopodis TaxID=117903 RepID=A0A3S5B0R7_9PLAT|nr:unnamed protein product [Protopolystoma xenopodis]